VPVAVRFGVVYLTLFALATQISGSLIPNPWFTYRGLGRLWPMREITHWVARTLFGVDMPLDDVSGGETLFFWIQWSWIVALSLAVTVVWSLLDRRAAFARPEIRRARPGPTWLNLAVRLALAASMIEYGMTKVIPTQFPAPPLTALVTPAGEMTLSALLWTTIGSAPAYQVATGCVELLAGVLLLFARTVPLGALLALVSLLQVLLLNLSFDIGVKLVTAHLIVLALILLAPDARTLATVLVGSRSDTDPAIRLKPDSTPSAIRPKSHSTSRAVRLKPDSTLVLLPIAIGVYLLATQAWINWSFWQVGGGGRPKSVLYGIWNVERLSVDGQARPAELNDYDRRWRRVIFDQPDLAVFQRTDDSFARYGVSIDEATGTLALTKGASRTWASRFTFDRTTDGGLSLDGEMDGLRIQADLRRVDPSAFPLLNSGFRWVRPHDP
jgi:hypothetical protein